MQSPIENISGRQAERRALAKAVAMAGRGAGSVSLIGGESGSGKSTLVESVLHELESDVLVLTARCMPEWATPYGTMTAVLESAQAGRGRRKLVKTDEVLAKLSLGEEDLSVADPSDAKSLVRLLVDAVWEICGDRTAVIFIDDLQWADESSLELLPGLAAEVLPRKVAVIATCSDDDLRRDHPVRTVRSRLRRFRHCREIKLKPLSSSEAAGLIDALLEVPPSRKLVQEIHRRSGGLPLFIDELCRSLRDGECLREGRKGWELDSSVPVPVPDTVRDAVSMQTKSLSSEGLEAIEIAAVLGSGFAMEQLLAMGAAESGIDELLERQLLVETGAGEAGFRHAMTRETVVDGIPWSRRRKLHGKAGDLLAKHQSSAAEGSIAEHYRDAGRHEDARRAFLKVAEMACAMHAFHEASRAFHQALELWPDDEEEGERISCMERLAQCAQASGYPGESARVWRDIVDSPVARAEPGRRALAYRSLASACELEGNASLASEARRGAMQAFVEAGQDVEAAREALGLADTDIVACRFAEGKKSAEQALKLARRAKDVELESLSLSEIGLALAMQGKETPARRKVEAGLDLAIRHKLKDATAAAYKQMAYVHGYQGDYDGQRKSFTSAVQFCQREGLDDEQHSCIGCMSYALFRMGEWKKSTEACRELLQSDEVGKGSKMLANASLGLVFAHRGQIKQARKCLEEAEAAALQFGIKPVHLIVRPTLAMIDGLADAAAAAESRYRDFVRMWETTEDRFDALYGLCLAASFFSEHQLREDLGACTAAVQAIAADNPNPESFASLAHVLGEAALLDDRAELAVDHFLKSRQHFERIQARYDVARSEFRMGEAFLKAGAKDTGIEHLRRGYTTAKSLGARPLQVDIRSSLEAEGAMAEEARHEDAPERAAKAGLTRRQREVAVLIAEGMTNKEAAQHLHLSPRTVDMHVSHLLDRLDCSTRSEAVRRLVDLGLLD